METPRSFDPFKEGLSKIKITNIGDRISWKNKVEELSRAWKTFMCLSFHENKAKYTETLAAELLKIVLKNPNIRLLDSQRKQLEDISCGKWLISGASVVLSIFTHKVPKKMTGRPQSSTTKTSKGGQSPISRSGGSGHSKSPRSVKTDEDKHEPAMSIDGIKAKATERQSQQDQIRKLQAIQFSISGTLSMMRKEESSQTGTKPKGQQNKDPKKGQNRQEAQPVNDDINSLVHNLTEQMAELGECCVQAKKRCDECHLDNNYIKQKIGQLHILVESNSHDDMSADEMIEDISKTLKEKYVRLSMTKVQYTQPQVKQKKPEVKSGGKMVQKKPENQLAKDDVICLIGDVHSQLTEFFQSLSEHASEAKRLQKENDDLSNKLSQLVSAKLSTNNPEIADLSDSDRPTKVAEQYLELYDNEWTDAFDSLTNQKMDDNKAIRVLLRCMTLSYSQCLHYSKLQELVMSGLLVLPGQTAEQMRQLKSELDDKEVQKLRKDVEKYGRPNIMKELSNEGIKEDKYIVQYTTECLQLCWLMCQQEPRIHIDVNISKYTGYFDKRLYREYTQKGKQIDFVVWPPLFIQEGGNMLGKGIANCK